MRFRIEVLGPFRLFDLLRKEGIGLRSNARLLAHLAVRAPAFVSRRALVAVVWPEVEPETANNRLRVALNKLRQTLPEAILQSPDGLALNPLEVECDALEFLNLIREAEDTSREADEMDTLLAATRFLGRNGGFQDWDLAPLAEILEIFYTASTRVGTLGLKLQRHAEVCEVCALALQLKPTDAALWKAMLQSRAALGQGEAAAKEIGETKDKALLANKEIRQILNRILKGETGEEELSLGESQLAVEILKATMAARPELAWAVLSSPATLTLSGAHPKEMLTLLERAVAQPGDQNSDWERCMARIVGLKAWVGDAQGVFDYGFEVVQRSEDPAILRATWNAIGLAHYLRRQWPEAMQAVETTLDYARQTGREIDVLSTLGNRAYYLWHQGFYEEAVREYDDALPKTRDLGTEQAKFEYAIGMGNRAFIPAMQGDWPRAVAWLEACNEQRTNGPVKIPMGTLLPCLAMSRAMTGQTAGVFAMLRQGFLDANATDWERYQQITFEFAACTLAQTEHKAYGRAVIDWVEAWRGRTHLPRAKAEVDLCELVFHDQPADPALSPDDSPSKVGRELLRRLRHGLGA